jgi:ribonucleoside-diphosphate reductase beta chain
MSVFSTTKTDFTKEPMFFGSDPNIARYDINKYSIFDKLTKKQSANFWTPEEIDLTKDSRDFKQLPKHNQFIFTKNLAYQILLDSIQGRSPNIALLPFISIPELEVCVVTWTYFETIHSRSYTHIIRNLYNDPSEVFDSILDDPQIIERAKAVTGQYDEFIEYANYYKLLGYGEHTINGKVVVIDEYELKTKLYLTIITIYILESVRFYVSFACSFAFAENSVLHGNASIISLIARDENIHTAITHTIRKLLVSDDPIFAKIIEENESVVIELFQKAADQEKEWVKYLFKDGSMIGLNDVMLFDYIEYMTNKRMKNLGVKTIFANNTNPLPWTNTYLSSKSLQVAKQETEHTSYLIGSVDSKLNRDLLKGFIL